MPTKVELKSFEIDAIKDEIEDKIIFILASEGKCKNLLSSVPHTFGMGLTMMYAIIQEKEDDCCYTLITNLIAEKLGLSGYNLHYTAMVNTKNIIPPETKTMADFINDISNRDFGIEDILDQDAPIYIITNKYKWYGANALLYENVFFELSNKLKSDLYIIPSSVHELIVIPASYIKRMDDDIKNSVCRKKGTSK